MTHPVRFAPHANPALFVPHFALIAAQCTFVVVSACLQLPGILPLGSLVLLTAMLLPPHRITVGAATVEIRHWLWTWRLDREDITEVAWDERKRFLTAGHGQGAGLLALRAPVQALALRRRHGPALILFGAKPHLEQIEQALRPPTA